MTRFRIATIVALIAAAPLLMAPSGGFPSKPRFNSVGVNQTPPTNPGELRLGGNASVQANGQLEIRGTSNVGNNNSYVGFALNNGTRIGYVGDGSGTASDIDLACDTNPCNVRLFAQGTGAVLVGAEALPMTYSAAFTTGSTSFLGRTANASAFTLTGASTGNITLNMIGVSCATLNCFPVCNTSTSTVIVVAGAVVSSANPGAFNITTSTATTGAAINAQVSCTITRG